MSFDNFQYQLNTQQNQISKKDKIDKDLIPLTENLSSDILSSIFKVINIPDNGRVIESSQGSLIHLGPNLDIQNEDLTDFDLEDLDFTNSDLSGSILIGANLKNSIFRNTNLNGVQLYTPTQVKDSTNLWIPEGYELDESGILLKIIAD